MAPRNPEITRFTPEQQELRRSKESFEERYFQLAHEAEFLSKLMVVDENTRVRSDRGRGFGQSELFAIWNKEIWGEDGILKLVSLPFAIPQSDGPRKASVPTGSLLEKVEPATSIGDMEALTLELDECETRLRDIEARAIPLMKHLPDKDKRIAQLGMSYQERATELLEHPLVHAE